MHNTVKKGYSAEPDKKELLCSMSGTVAPLEYHSAETQSGHDCPRWPL